MSVRHADISPKLVLIVFLECVTQLMVALELHTHVTPQWMNLLCNILDARCT